MELKSKMEISGGDYDVSIARQRVYLKEIAKLEKEANALRILDEDQAFSTAINLANKINRTTKNDLGDYDDYETFYEKLEELTKARLLAEGKITEAQSKTWTFATSSLSDENKDKVLSKKSALTSAWTKKTTDLNTINPHLIEFGRYFQRHFKGPLVSDLSKFLEEWLKNKDNIEKAEKTRQALEKMAETVKLPEDKQEILEAIKKSDLVPKDMETILKHIIEKATKT